MGYYKTYLIHEDETLQSIAFKKLGDTSKWGTLVTLNDLQYPYIVATNQQKLTNPEHLKTIGDTIYLPTTNEIESIIADNMGAFTKNTIYDITLGMDLELKIDADSAIEEAIGEVVANSSGDLTVVSGIENLKQSLFMRIMTRKGTLLNHANYGSRFPDYIGSIESDAQLKRAVTELNRTITTDSRVSSATVSTAEILKDGTIFLEVDITPISFDTAFNLFIVRSNSGEVSLK